MNYLNKFLRICLLSCILSFIFLGSNAAASTVENTISQALVQIDFKEKINFLEEYHIHFAADQDKIKISIPLQEAESKDLFQTVTLAENNTTNPLFMTAAKMEDNQKEQSGLLYQVEIDESRKNIQLTIFYGFKAESDYILRITMDRMNCLQKSTDNLFVEYPISYPSFAANADQFFLKIDLPAPISENEYKMQAVAETWFKEILQKSDSIQYMSEGFHFRDQQKIYMTLPADLAATYSIKQTELTVADFFPNVEEASLKNNLFLTILKNPSITIGLAGLMLVLAFFVYLFIEQEMMFKADALPLNLSIFELDAAHGGMLYAVNRHSSLLLAGLLQLVQKNELALNRTVFQWLNPERENFEDLSSSEIFILQWLFPIKENHKGERTAYFSVEKLKIRVNNNVWAEEYSENFNRYLQLLKEDLFSLDYLSKERKNLGKNIYKSLLILCCFLAFSLFLINQSSFNLLFLIPVLFISYRLKKGRYFTLKGKRKWKQLQLLRAELQNLPVLLKKFNNRLAIRDLAPLLLPYAISYNHLESFLKQINSLKKAKIGLLDLFNTNSDYDEASSEMIEQDWQKAKNDMLFMYYALEASFVEAEIIRQETLMEFDEHERK